MKKLLYLNAAQVKLACRDLDPIATVTSALAAVRDGEADNAQEAALRWIAADGTQARSLVLPARFGDTYGCKIINACIGNITQGIPRAHGLIVLFDKETAIPVCIMEGGYISALRTAAVSVAALNALRDGGLPRHVAFLGCGQLARSHAELLATRTTMRGIAVYDLIGDRARTFAAELGELAPEAAITVADGWEMAVSDAEVVIAATTTTTAYVRLEHLAEGATFVNVSLDDATEELLMGCDHLFVDDWELVSADATRLLGRLARRGRIAMPGRAAPPGGRVVDAELACLLAGKYRRPVTATDRVVINPFGMGVSDVAFAARAYESARDASIGTWLGRLSFPSPSAPALIQPSGAQRGRGDERLKRAVIDNLRQSPGHPGQEVSDLHPRIISGVDHQQPGQRGDSIRYRVSRAGASRRVTGTIGQYPLKAPQPVGCEGALLVVGHQYMPPVIAAPEQHSLGQRRQHGLQRRRNRRVTGEQAGQHGLHSGGAEPGEDSLGLRANLISKQRVPRLEEPCQGHMIRPAPSLDPEQVDKRGEEDAPVAVGPASRLVHSEGSRTLLLRQAGTGRVRRFGQQQVDDPGEDEVLLVDQMHVRPVAQRC